MTLRPWKISDAKFVCQLRNDPKLNRWFRQDEPLKLEDERHFIKFSLERNSYPGQIVEEGGKAVGCCAVASGNEMCIAAPLRYHEGIVKLLLEQTDGFLNGDVFVGNPALPIYIKNGFRIDGVKERAYYKKAVGLIDIVHIIHDNLKRPEEYAL